MLTPKLYCQITGIIFFVVGSAHLLRLLMSWSVVLNGYTLPLWVSYLGVLVAWFLAYNAFQFAKKLK